MTRGWVRRLAAVSRPPTGVDRLLRVWLTDERTAADAWAAFEASADLDHLPGPEMCLVGLVSKRLPVIAPNSALRGRIGGIERANWSRTQLTLGEAMQAVHLLKSEDIPVLLVGNAARIAKSEMLGRGLRIEMIDCCIRPVDIPRAHDLLIADGWQYASPGAVDRRSARAACSCRFVRGRFGGLELRRSAFAEPLSEGVNTNAVWQRATPGHLGEVSVLIPSPTDSLAIIIADGIGRSHFNGRWLADVAMATGDGVDWLLFDEESDRHGLDAAAFYSLLSAHDRLARAVPEEALGRLERSASRRALRTVPLLAEFRSRDRLTLVSRAVAGFARRLRLFIGGGAASSSLKADPRALKGEGG